MKKKYYKEINSLSFDFVFDNSPIEFLDATNLYDIETFDYVLVLRMKNVSGRKLKSVSIRLNLYSDMLSYPYKKIDYIYNLDTHSQIFGEKSYIPIPQTFYKKFDVILKEVVFENGESQKFNLSTTANKTEFIANEESSIITACELIETSESLNESFPAVVMPRFAENAWICCCSHKNDNTKERCECCSRERSWLEKTYDKENLLKVARGGADGTLTMTKRVDKAKFLEKRDFKPLDEVKERIIEEECDKVEKRERYKDKMRIQALPRLVLYFVSAFAIYYLVCLLTGQI